ncbi:MAG: metal ABC transporter ATP-binding protein [Verrucomicrobiota bacterium]|nr:metal ABC transporter ATP-binding protein [Verrucomicrobiota bacterium]
MNTSSHNCIDHHLQIKNLTVSYNRVPAVHHLSVQIDCGACVAVIGPNGAGKTTLLKAVARLLPFETGEINFHSHAGHDHSSVFAYLPQREKVDWDFPLTVRGLAELGRYSQLGWRKPFTARDEEKVTEALHTMGLCDLADRQIKALSGGQQQRAFLARALAQEAHVFLLDEPFTGLDVTSQVALGRTIKSLAEKGNLVMAAHHDLDNVHKFYSHILFINGELIDYGPVAKVHTPENIKRTYNTPVFSGPHPSHPHHHHDVS